MAILFTRLRDDEARTVVFRLGYTLTDFHIGTVFLDDPPKPIDGTTVVEVNIPDVLIKGGSVIDSVEIIADEQGNPVDKVPGHTLTLSSIDGLPFTQAVQLPFRALNL